MPPAISLKPPQLRPSSPPMHKLFLVPPNEADRHSNHPRPLGILLWPVRKHPFSNKRRRGSRVLRRTADPTRATCGTALLRGRIGGGDLECQPAAALWRGRGG